MQNKPRLIGKNYLLPFILITSLFFLWGFARSILDVLNKHFQESLDISIINSTMIQATIYMAYALMALPAGIIITRYGYRRGIVAGLLLFGIGSLSFIPGDIIGSFGVFLCALFVIGCGLAILETAANPYTSELGPPSTAASRLNLAQSFNGLGSILGPVIVGGVLFSGSATISVPYAIMGLCVLTIAFLFSRVQLPEMNAPTDKKSATVEIGSTIRQLWSSRHFKSGVVALFCYEVAEISINSLFINYVTEDGWMDKLEATRLLSFGALGLFMLMRVVGSSVMKFVRAERVLTFCAVMAMGGALTVVFGGSGISKIGLFACYAFEAIMFPTIFALTLTHAGSSPKIASSFLMMTPLGGAVGTALMGAVASVTTISTSFIIPALAYGVVLLFSLSSLRLGKFHTLT